MTIGDDKNDSFQPLAALLSAALPGAGQIFLGHRARGLFIMLGVLGLFLSGLFVGGLSCVDSRENKIWFIGQALCGPVAFLTDALHQNFYKGAVVTGPNAGKRITPGPDETLVKGPGGQRMVAQRNADQPPAIVKSIGRANELGVLFGAIAGMLNLICIIDAAWSRRAAVFQAPGARS
jgi:TM2 domain-containing membrane protein YozV